MHVLQIQCAIRKHAMFAYLATKVCDRHLQYTIGRKGRGRSVVNHPVVWLDT